MTRQLTEREYLQLRNTARVLRLSGVLQQHPEYVPDVEKMEAACQEHEERLRQRVDGFIDDQMKRQGVSE